MSKIQFGHPEMGFARQQKEKKGKTLDTFPASIRPTPMRLLNVVRVLWMVAASMSMGISCSAPAKPDLPSNAALSAPSPSPSPSPPGSSALTALSVLLPTETPLPVSPTISVSKAEEILFLGKTPSSLSADCPLTMVDSVRIQCFLERRYAVDPKAQKLALELYKVAGDVAGIEPPQLFDGGYRGMINLVPELPIDKYRQHLAWVTEGAKDFDATYQAIEAAVKKSGKSLRYRWTAITLQFFRSVGRTTPNGFARGWGYSYNVSGSLLHSVSAVTELMVHEIFHLNDHTHGGWSESNLDKIHEGILTKCGTKIPCLKPYTPHDTIVRGGTYYAFQPSNGPAEYAAELAIRHFREHRAIVRGESPIRPAFKCGPTENAKAWRLFVDEMWAGIDLTPSCP